ncbi:MAG: DUF4112 domain-containing protein [Leptolyngbyaceae cyanobacterium bins.59]|nr:DUF4112 domain-containing protein [Leptolyngbyaceae cyanobacterium bins.59]
MIPESPVPTQEEAILKRVRLLSHVLDNAVPIPGTSYRVGIDPLLGLLPGGGDVVGGALSAYLVLEASRLGLPRATLVRMVTNIIIESLAGTVPVIGDLFDVTWKANARNLALLEHHVRSPRTTKAADRRFVILLLVGLAIVVIGIASFVVFMLSLLLRAIGGG